MKTADVALLRDLLLSDDSGLSPASVDAVRAAVAEDVEERVEIGFPKAVELIEIYEYRCQSIEGFKASRFGWEEFFSALEGEVEIVGMASIQSRGWRLLALFDRELTRALACLCRPPD